MTDSVQCEKRLISVKEVARILGVSERNVWAKVASGKMPKPLPFGGRRLWRVAEIDAWIEAGMPESGWKWLPKD